MATLSIIQQELQSIVDTAYAAAEKDGSLSQDERTLLTLLKQHLSSIEEELSGILEMIPKDLDESQIRKRVRLLAQDIIPQLIEEAKSDGVFSLEEKLLLDQIVRKII